MTPKTFPLNPLSQSRLLLLSLSLLTLLLSGCGDQDAAQSSVNSQVIDGASESAATEGEGEEVAATTAIEQLNSRGRQVSHFLLGTGSVQGVYFPIGGVICRLLNRHQYLHNIRCSLESTGGSISNLRQLRERKFDLVFAQSDWQFHAYHGSSTFEKDGPLPELRSVFALEADPLALMVKVESEVEEFDDLENRVVSFGYSRSLQYRIIKDYLEVKGWQDNSFKQIRRMSDIKQVGALCRDEVEAILLLSSSLNDYLRDIDDDCHLRAVPIVGPEVDKVISGKPFYRTGTVQTSLYIDGEKDVESFGLGASFVALESTSPKAIYHVVKEVVENFKDFQSLHPSLKNLSQKELPHAGLSAPLHPGAVRYYREARLL